MPDPKAPVQDPNEYPKWKYSASKPAVVVQDDKEEKKLGPGYYNSPADIGKPPGSVSSAPASGPRRVKVLGPPAGQAERRHGLADRRVSVVAVATDRRKR